MRKTWATFGVDLHLELGGARPRQALEDALREAIRTGRLSAGTRIPSSRSLAPDLGIARNTVAAAYGQLVAEGWLQTRQGSATRVAERAPSPAPPSPRVAAVAPRARHDLRPGAPDLASFPRAGWLTAARRALHEAPVEALGYGDPRGLLELRQALVDYLSRARGVAASADRIVICSGFTHGLALVCRALHARGATSMAIEAYGHRTHRDAVVASGFEPTLLPVDGSGAEVELLDDAAAVVLTPAHQFPLGPVLSPGRRLRVAAWARESGSFVIEDDYDGEFRFDRQPIGAMQALAPEQIVYAGTASKSLAPGLQLGWLVVPGELLPDVLDARRHLGGPSAIEQLTLARFIAAGRYDRHIRRARLAYRRRRDRLETTLARRAPGAHVTGTAAGMHAVVLLPTGRDEDEVSESALERGLLVEGLAAYRRGDGGRSPALVVGYATPPEHAFTAAVGRLAAVLGGP